MAHLYLATRGPKHIRDQWVANMQSQLSKWPRWSLTVCECNHVKHEGACKIEACKCPAFQGKKEMWGAGWHLNPIELWEIVVPEDAVPEVMWYNKIPGDKKQCHAGVLEKLAKIFRLGMKLEKMPTYDEKTLKIEPNRLIYTDSFSIYGLGMKKDKFSDHPQWGYRQEDL